MKFSCPLIRISGVIYPELVKREKYIFLLFLALSMVQIWLTKYVPSLDGPQHLYNAQVLSELIKGNDLMGSFFKVNDVIVGYWSGHFFLTLFKLFLPAWLAEKLFLTAYVLGVIFSFRYLVRSINPDKGNFVSYLIFPFIYHTYLTLGYYTFSIAAIFFFLAFGYYIRNVNSFNWRRVLIFSLLLLGLFLSHGLVFVIFGFSFVVYFVLTSLYQFIIDKPNFNWKRWIQLAGKLLVAAIPSVVLWVIYIQSVMSINNTVTEPSYSFMELVKFLARIRQLVGFHHEMESVGYVPLFILITLLFASLAYLFFIQSSRKVVSLFNRRNAFFWVAAAILGLYFFAPDRFSAGNLTNRFGLFFFLVSIAWLSFHHFSRSMQLLALVVVLSSFSYTRYVHQQFLKGLNKDVTEIVELSDYIEPNSVVHSLRSTDNWVHVHFQLYGACDISAVHLKNPQCQGQFPVVWNYERLPLCYAGEREVIPAGALKRVPENGSVEIDYITVFKYKEYMQDSTNAVWHQILANDYKLVHMSSRGNAALFEKVGNP